MSWATGLALFFAYLILDMAYAYYTECVTRRRPFMSAHLAVLIYSISAYGVKSYIEDWRHILPILLGSWIGTYISVHLIDKQSKKKKG